tara:strand:- start:1790 stop:2122 length:333 start_codon:yes stop_codon:yes gene_type:complete
MKLLNKRRLAVALAGVTVATALTGVGAVAASADENWWYPAFNCGTNNVYTSSYANAYVSHTHSWGGVDRRKSWDTSGYRWNYYASGYTNTTWSVINSTDDVSNGYRVCDY